MRFVEAVVDGETAAIGTRRKFRCFDDYGAERVRTLPIAEVLKLPLRMPFQMEKKPSIVHLHLISSPLTIT